MTMIGDENEGAIMDWIIHLVDNLPDSYTYEDLDGLRKTIEDKHE